MNRAACSVALVAVALTGTLGHTFAEQASRAAEPEFVVASVKPVQIDTFEKKVAAGAQASKELGPGLTMVPGGRCLVRYSTLRRIMQEVYPAYSRLGLIVGGPAWIDSQYFEIDARAPDNSTTEDIERMAERLLVDRFRLQVRTVMRPLNVYALTVIRDDKKLGRGLSPPIECDPKPTFGPDGMPIPGLRPRCQVSLKREGAALLLSGAAAPISELANWIQMRMDRPVVDRTGLAGDFAIRFDVPKSLPAEPGNLQTGVADLFTAVREQLGLALVPRIEETTVLMVDHVEMPSPN